MLIQKEILTYRGSICGGPSSKSPVKVIETIKISAIDNLFPSSTCAYSMQPTDGRYPGAFALLVAYLAGFSS